MKILAKTLITCSIFILCHCKNVEQNQTDVYKTLATQKFGPEVEYIPNEEGSMVLCLKKQKDESNAGYGVAFLVFDTKQKMIIYEEEIGKGSVTWHSNQELALFYTPGIMRSDQTRDDFTYIYHLTSKEKTLKSKL